jgi:hypothetical protein
MLYNATYKFEKNLVFGLIGTSTFFDILLNCWFIFIAFKMCFLLKKHNVPINRGAISLKIISAITMAIFLSNFRIKVLKMIEYDDSDTKKELL